MTKALFLLHFAASWFLVGLCWLVQRVQCRLVDRVGRAGYAAYEQAHASLVSTNWIRTLAWSIRGGLLFWILRATWLRGGETDLSGDLP